MGLWADRLIGRCESSRTWPMRQDVERWKKIGRWIAWRESDRDALEDIAGWEPSDPRRYMIDPLAPLISRAFSRLIFGRLPEFTAADPDDQPRLDDLLSENRLGPSLRRGAITSSSEGEVWWRIHIDREVADFPLVEWHSRAGVVPLFRSGRLKACAFIDRLEGDVSAAQNDVDTGPVYRHFEVHDDEHVINLLYRGTSATLGARVSLSEHDDTADLSDEPWAHGMGEMLAGWIPNEESVDPTQGISDYDDIEDLLLEANEILSTGSRNVRLTARKRMVVSKNAVDETGTVPVDREFFIDDSADKGLGVQTSGNGPWQTIEYQFDAGGLIQWGDSIAVKALGRKGITPQFVGMPTDPEGSATSGVALRVRLIPSTQEGDDRAQHYEDRVPRIVTLLQRLDAAPYDPATGRGGFQRTWRAPDELPTMDRGTTLPEERSETSVRVQSEVETRLKSRHTAIAELNGWDEDRVEEELRLIAEDEAGILPGVGDVPVTDDLTDTAGDGAGVQDDVVENGDLPPDRTGDAAAPVPVA